MLLQQEWKTVHTKSEVWIHLEEKTQSEALTKSI